MTRTRLVMDASLERLKEQVPGGNAPELVEFALHHATMYGSLASDRSLHNERPDAEAWYDEAQEESLKLVADQVPELANECNRRIKERSRGSWRS